jgi:ABC-type nitrate/sulfonate/bicarbonate transport system ATPase subunit
METKRAEILSVEHLTKSFGKLKVLSDINFNVCKGELIAILGPSGCGKTTLLRAIAGLIPFDSGHIRLNGQEAAGRESRGAAMVFQEPRLLPWRTVSGNLRLPFELEGDTDKADSSVREILALVGLAEFAAAYPHELSGGMRSRVALARALATNPGLLLMDEPLTGLDVRTREELQDEIIRIWVKKKMSLVWVTHAPEEAVYLADRVIVLSRRPTTVKEVICIDLGRPRDRRDPALQRFSADIRRLFE